MKIENQSGTMNYISGKIAYNEFGPKLPRCQHEEGNQKRFTLSMLSSAMVATSSQSTLSRAVTIKYTLCFKDVAQNKM